jgi:hypothetical protein
MYFQTIFPLLSLLPFLTSTLADPHAKHLHPKQLHSTPPHRALHLNNRNTMAESIDPKDARKVLVKRKKRSNCQVTVGAGTSTGDVSVSISTTEGVSTPSMSTSTSTSAAAAAESTSPASTGSGGLLERLFPVEGSADWTTCTEAPDALSCESLFGSTGSRTNLRFSFPSYRGVETPVLW